MFTVKRLHRLTDYRDSSPEGLSMLPFEAIFKIFALKCVRFLVIWLKTSEKNPFLNPLSKDPCNKQDRYGIGQHVET